MKVRVTAENNIIVIIFNMIMMNDDIRRIQLQLYLLQLLSVYAMMVMVKRKMMMTMMMMTMMMMRMANTSSGCMSAARSKYTIAFSATCHHHHDHEDNNDDHVQEDNDFHHYQDNDDHHQDHHKKSPKFPKSKIFRKSNFFVKSELLVHRSEFLVRFFRFCLDFQNFSGRFDTSGSMIPLVHSQFPRYRHMTVFVTEVHVQRKELGILVVGCRSVHTAHVPRHPCCQKSKHVQ